QARVLRIDEDHLAILADAQLVDIQVADRLGVARDIALVELVMDHLVRAQHILEAPQLEQAPEIETLRIAHDTHGTREEALEEGHPALLVAADEVKTARLVGRNGQGQLVAGQPAGQSTRTAFLHRRLRRVDDLLLVRRFGRISERRVGRALWNRCGRRSLAAYCRQACRSATPVAGLREAGIRCFAFSSHAVLHLSIGSYFNDGSGVVIQECALDTYGIVTAP